MHKKDLRERSEDNFCSSTATDDRSLLGELFLILFLTFNILTGSWTDGNGAIISYVLLTLWLSLNTGVNEHQENTAALLNTTDLCGTHYHKFFYKCL